jgi:hypothetical protein
VTAEAAPLEGGRCFRSHRPTTAGSGVALVALLLGMAAFMGARTPASALDLPSPEGTTILLAQATTAEPDTVRPDPEPTPTAPEPRADEPIGRDKDRLELGAAMVDGPFDVLGTLGYHRIVRVSGPFEQAVHVELSGGAVDNLKEGSASVGYFLRPLLTFRRSSKLRPLLEFGPAGHLSVQVADIEGFGETAFHAHGYLKSHAYAGFEALLGNRWGLVVRGRFSVPAHHPLDYAQAAVFLR